VVNAQLVTLVRQSETPIARSALYSVCRQSGASRADVDEHLRSLVEGARIYAWSKDRFWNEPELTFYMDHARELVRQKPLWKSALCKKLEDLGYGSPKSVYERVFQMLKKETDVHCWPAHRHLRGESLSLKALDLDYYLGELRKLYQQAAKKLTNSANLEEHELLGYISGKPLAPSPPSNSSSAAARTATEPPSSSPPQPKAAPQSESDLDYQRDVSEHLIFCWNDAPSAEVREHLEVVMYNIGLTRFGRRDEVVAFNGIEHQSSDSIFPGDLATILEPGWMLQRGSRKRILAKANVSPN